MDWKAYWEAVRLGDWPKVRQMTAAMTEDDQMLDYAIRINEHLCQQKDRAEAERDEARLVARRLWQLTCDTQELHKMLEAHHHWLDEHVPDEQL